MKKSLITAFTLLILTSCGGGKKTSEQTTASSSPKEGIEVLYFHGKQRCITCNAIEQATKEVLENDFSEEIKNGKVFFRIIDISTKEGEIIADRYEVTWSSLFVNQWKKGVETKNNMTDYGFSYAKNSPEVFKDGIKKAITDLLN